MSDAVFWSLVGVIICVVSLALTHFTRTKAQSLVRILRRWNQSGQKHAGASDIAGVVLSTRPALLLVLVLATFLETCWKLSSKSYQATKVYGSWIPLAAALSLLSTVATFKLSFTLNDSPELFGISAALFAPLQHHLPDLVMLARLSYILLGLSLTAIRWRAQRLVPTSISRDPNVSPSLRLQATPKHDCRMADVTNYHNAANYIAIDKVRPLITTFLIIQTRVTNIPQFVIYAILDSQFHGHLEQLSASSITLLTLLFAHVSYFSAGGTNSISSIDLSNAYNGISSFSPSLVGLLLFSGNWAGPIWWSFAGLDLQLKKATGKRRPLEAWYNHVCLMSLFMAAMVLGVLAACALLRTHLFVWTVFSPKFLYAGAWLGWHLAVNIGLGYIMVALGG